MSAGDEDDLVGYRQPPKVHRLKKARGGNPIRRRMKVASESTLAMIDRLLTAPVSIKVNGETKRIPVVEAIILQLMQKDMAGHARAGRVLAKYRDFMIQNSNRQLRVVYVETDYTKALATLSERADDDHGGL